MQSAIVRLTITLVLLIASSTAVWAQDFDFNRRDLRSSMHVGIGYSGNLPSQILGGTAILILPGTRGWGIFGDMKTSVQSPKKLPNFEPDLDVIHVETVREIDEQMSVHNSWRSFNMGLVRAVGPDAMIYAGAGISKGETFHKYYDPLEELGAFGVYWVGYPEASKREVNILAGTWLRMTRNVFFQLGAEMKPIGFTAGIGFALPTFR